MWQRKVMYCTYLNSSRAFESSDLCCFSSFSSVWVIANSTFLLFAIVVMNVKRDERYPLIAASFPSRNCKEMCVSCLNLFDSTIVRAPPVMSRFAVNIEELYSDKFWELTVLLRLSVWFSFEFKHSSISSMSLEGNTRNSTNKDWSRFRWWKSCSPTSKTYKKYGSFSSVT